MSSCLYRAVRIMPISFGILVLGCGENRAVNPTSRNVEASVVAPDASIQSAQARGDSLARGLALALGDPAVRMRLRDDLRDSPFRFHAIHLRSYLGGTSGQVLAAKAADALGIAVAAFLTISDSVANLELVLPRPLDRISWEGSSEIDIAAVSMTLRERQESRRVAESGYDVGGNAKSVTTVRYSRRPYMILRPAEYMLPANPEGLRLAAPRHVRNTITTSADERAYMRRRGRETVAREKLVISATPSGVASLALTMLTPPGCDPEADPLCCPEWADYCPEDPPDGGGPPGSDVGGGGATLPPEMTQYYCYGLTSPLDGTNDRDNDRIRDDCELAIASSLAPLLNIGHLENWGARQPYWSVSRHPDRDYNIQIIYALAYLDDGGDYSTGSGSHVGDSEFIILEVANSGTGSIWGVRYATLSAHFQWEFHDDTSTYYWDDLEYPSGASPRIWASLAKHGNYRNRAACEGSFFATCHDDYSGFSIPVTSSHNLGNYFHVPESSRDLATQLANCTFLRSEPPVWPNGRGMLLAGY